MIAALLDQIGREVLKKNNNVMIHPFAICALTVTLVCAAELTRVRAKRAVCLCELNQDQRLRPAMSQLGVPVQLALLMTSTRQPPTCNPRT